MNITEYFSKKKNIEEKLLKYLDEEENEEENFENFVQIIKNENILSNQHDLKIILYLINRISIDHQRHVNFFNKIFQVLKMMNDEMRKHFSNDELFKIFKTNKRILLFLIDEKIFSIDKSIYNEMKKEKYQKMRIPEYFSYEIEPFLHDEQNNQYTKTNFYIKIQEILKEDFSKINEKRKKGENEKYLCEIIRKDLIEDFIIYVNKESYPLNSYITNSIFETNCLLMKQSKTKLIEYAAFYGSTQIFRYLYKNGSQITPNLWLYAVHGCDEEIIHYLEDNTNISNEFYKLILNESIKSHHENICNYIAENFIKKNETIEEEIMLNCLKYYNFINFDLEKIDNFTNSLFYFSCKYDYYTIVEFFLKTKNIEYDKELFMIAENKSNCEILSLLLCLIGNEIKNDFFKLSNKLKQITIPSSITSIGNNAFSDCSSLKQITIPSSVTSIGRNAFSYCSSLTQIIIPSSVNSIKESTFCECSSLSHIIIPFSVTSIGNYAFNRCSSLTHIIIPSSVTSIGKYAFSECSSLKQITIPSSVFSIGNDAFIDCTSLTQVIFEIPSSVTSIGNYSFSGCSSLTQITIPSSISSIGKYAFSQCSSLSQITIPSSVSSIRNNAFASCSSLKQISIPSSITSIEWNVFRGCSSLTKVSFEIPSSVTSIENNAFSECLSLTEITIPSSVTSIGNYAFSYCSSLTQIIIPSSVTSIGDLIFIGCTSLTNVTFPSSFNVRQISIRSEENTISKVFIYEKCIKPSSWCIIS